MVFLQLYLSAVAAQSNNPSLFYSTANSGPLERTELSENCKLLKRDAHDCISRSVSNDTWEGVLVKNVFCLHTWGCYCAPNPQ